MDPDASLDDVKFEMIAALSEEECKQALAIAIRKIADAIKMSQIRFSQASAFIKLNEVRRKQKCQWDKKASQPAHEVDRLNAELEAREKEVKKMASSVNSYSKRLKTLLSTSQTVAKGKNAIQWTVLKLCERI